MIVGPSREGRGDLAMADDDPLRFKYDFLYFRCRQCKDLVGADDAEFIRRIDGTCGYCVRCERYLADEPPLRLLMHKRFVADVIDVLDIGFATIYTGSDYDKPQVSDHELYYSQVQPANLPLSPTIPDLPVDDQSAWGEDPLTYQGCD